MSQTFAQLINGKSATVEFSTGSATTPSVAFSGDTNTGIYSPGADQVAISTGGSGRLFVDASGRVGINQSSPNVNLTVTTTASGEGIRLTNGTNSERLHFYTGSNALVEANNANLALTAKDAYALILSTTNLERLRVTSAGLVGVGTSSPGSTLQVNGETRLTRSGVSDQYVSFTGDATANYITSVSSVGNAKECIIQADANSDLLRIKTQAAKDIVFHTNNTERARIDSSGRLLVGTSSSLGGTVSIAGGGLYLSANDSNAEMQLTRASANTGSPLYYFNKARGTYASPTVVSDGDVCGTINFRGHDGSAYIAGASITAAVDGTPGANDMPGRLVFSTTADGASSPTEQLRITNDGVRGYNQAAPVAVDTTATLTVANLKNGIITSTTAAAVTGTLPTGTLTEGGFSGLYNNFTFEWTVINTGATNNFTVAAGTAHTVVGNMVVAAGNSGRFATRRTAANTFVTYRLSS